MKQGEGDWLAVRLGKVTASEVGKALITPQFAKRKGEGVQTYLYQKLAERIMGYAPDNGSTFAMNQGQIVETIAIPWYNFAHDVKIERVGFCEHDSLAAGCSPDGLIGEDGGIEIKSPQPPTHLKYLLAGEVPDDYVMQVQMCLWITGRKWWKFVSYSPYLPALVLHVDPIKEAQDALSAVVPEFCADLDAGYAKISTMMTTGGRA